MSTDAHAEMSKHISAPKPSPIYGGILKETGATSVQALICLIPLLRYAWLDDSEMIHNLKVCVSAMSIFTVIAGVSFLRPQLIWS